MSATLAPAIIYSEILVATDFSDASHNALTLAKAIAHRFDSRILAVHVSEPTNPITVPESQWFYSQDTAALDEATMEQLREDLEEDGLTAHVSCPTGAVGQEILRTARGEKADLVVLGTRALTRVKRWLLGSVAEEVARNLRVPLIVIGPKAISRHTNRIWHLDHILCAASLDHEGRQVALYSSALAHEMQANWQIACDPTHRGSQCVSLEDFQQDLRRELASAGLNHHGVTPLLLTRPHAEQLAELALIRKSDLVVIGHGHQFMEWSAIRSGTIPRLLAEAPCPVLILPANPPEPR